MPTQKSLIEDARPDMAGYETLYKYIHKHPELSHQEAETASLIVRQLKALSANFEIRTGIGGHGLVAILRNGPGSTVLLRADFDALPVAEKTNLEYASVRTQIDSSGKETPVMHGKEAQALVLTWTPGS